MREGRFSLPQIFSFNFKKGAKIMARAKKKICKNCKYGIFDMGDPLYVNCILESKEVSAADSATSTADTDSTVVDSNI